MGNKRKITSINELSKKLSLSYPDLRVSQIDKVIQIEGSLPIYAGDKILDRYLIKICANLNYPRNLPIVYEIGGRIPKVVDRHFNKDSEEACVCLKDEWYWIASKYPTLFEFVIGPVTHFFTWQASYEFYGEDKLGGWAHFGDGRLEFYMEKLDTSDVEVVKKFLILLANPKYEPNWICYCGSGQKVFKCHKATVLNLRSKIPPKVAKSAYTDISQSQKSKNSNHID